MSFKLRGILLGLGGCVLALVHTECSSSGTLSANCNALYNCCSQPNFDPSMAPGCQETAQNSTDQSCASQLLMMEEQNQCPVEGGVPLSDAAADAAAADAGKD